MRDRAAAELPGFSRHWGWSERKGGMCWRKVASWDGAGPKGDSTGLKQDRTNLKQDRTGPRCSQSKTRN